MSFKIFVLIVLLWGLGSTSFAEENDHVFGLRWQMSIQKIMALELGKIREIKKSHGKVEYQIDKPKKPIGANMMILQLFNDNLYHINVKFVFRRNHDLNQKYKRMSEFLTDKHSGAKIKETTLDLNFMGMADAKLLAINYIDREDESKKTIENPQKLESISLTTMPQVLYKGTCSLDLSYAFYGSENIYRHIKKLEQQEEFGEF